MLSDRPEASTVRVPPPKSTTPLRVGVVLKLSFTETMLPPSVSVPPVASVGAAMPPVPLNVITPLSVFAPR